MTPEEIAREPNRSEYERLVAARDNAVASLERLDQDAKRRLGRAEPLLHQAREEAAARGGKVVMGYERYTGPGAGRLVLRVGVLREAKTARVWLKLHDLPALQVEPMGNRWQGSRGSDAFEFWEVDP